MILFNKSNKVIIMPRIPSEFIGDKTKVVCPNKYTSKTIEYCLLYQTNLGEFPRPIRFCKGFTVYSVYVGVKYLKFNVTTKPTKTSPIFLTISLFEIPKGFGLDIIDEQLLVAEIPKELYQQILEDPDAPPVLKAVLDAMPKEPGEYADYDHDVYFGYAYYTELVEQIKNYLESLSAKVD